MLSKQLIAQLVCSNRSLEQMVIDAYKLGHKDARQGCLDVCNEALLIDENVNFCVELINEEVTPNIEVNDASI